MDVNRVEPKNIKGKELEILFFGDLHIGSKDCDMNAIKRQIAWIKNNPNVVVIMMGDTVNCALKHSPGAGSFDDDKNPSDQIDFAIELLTPIKNKIYGIHNGNHGNRIYNETTISPEKVIAKSLGVPYLGDTCFHYVRFKSQSYIIFSAHGSTAGTSITGSFNSCMKYAQYAHADIYAMGHTHQLGAQSQVHYMVDKQNKTLIKKKRDFILTGGYLNWKGSYAESKNYAPLRIGSAKVILSGDRFDIHVRT